MRKINTKDVFQLARIIKKLNLKELATQNTAKINDTLENMSDSEEDAKKLGINIIFSIIENIPEAEFEIYQFIAGISGFEVYEIEEMAIDDFIEIIREIVQENDIKKVFTSALSLMQK